MASLVEAELLVDKSAAPDPVELGQPLAYTVTVTNLGPQAATGVTMIDRLPGSMTFGAAVASQRYLH